MQVLVVVWLQLMHPNQQLQPQLHMDVDMVGVVLQLLVVIWLQLMHPNQQLHPQLHVDMAGLVLELLQLHVSGVMLELMLLNPL